MLSGKSFIKSYKKSMMLGPISSYQSYPSVTLLPNGLLIEAFSVLVVFPKKISTD
jgi:hypothetical protein